MPLRSTPWTTHASGSASEANAAGTWSAIRNAARAGTRQSGASPRRGTRRRRARSGTRTECPAGSCDSPATRVGIDHDASPDARALDVGSSLDHPTDELVTHDRVGSRRCPGGPPSHAHRCRTSHSTRPRPERHHRPAHRAPSVPTFQHAGFNEHCCSHRALLGLDSRTSAPSRPLDPQALDVILGDASAVALSTWLGDTRVQREPVDQSRKCHGHVHGIAGETQRAVIGAFGEHVLNSSTHSRLASSKIVRNESWREACCQKSTNTAQSTPSSCTSGKHSSITRSSCARGPRSQPRPRARGVESEHRSRPSPRAAARPCPGSSS